MSGAASTDGGRNGALEALFNPRIVAVVGVSRDRIKRGRQVLSNVMSGGFGGRVFGVGRNITEADGAPCFPSVAALPERPDVVFLAVPAATTPQTLQECADLGVKVAIIGSAGFAENADSESVARQAELARIVGETGIRVVGPNCNGVYNAHSGLALGFNAAHSIRMPRGGIAILSHSGALFSVMAGYMAAVQAGLSLFVSSGNEADFDLLDYLEYALEDETTRVVALLLDAISDGNRLRRLGERAVERGKRIVALKIGMSEAGARAAIAHSSRMAGSAQGYAALLEASGIAMASSLESLIAIAALLDRYGRADGGIGVFTTSGAGAAMMADLAERHSVPLARYREATHAALGRYVSFSTAGNPTDLGVFERGRSGEVPAIVAADPDVGAMLALLNPINPNSGVPTLLEDLAQARSTSGKPLAVVIPGGVPDDLRARYEADDMPVFPDTESTLQGMRALLMPPPPTVREIVDGLASPPAADPAAEPLLGLARALTEPESLSLLQRFGIATVPTRVCTGVDAGISAAEELGWPVVAKAVVAGMAHKSDAGLVQVGIKDADELRDTYLAFGHPERLAIQPLVTGRAEAIIGATWSEDIGWLLMAGLGGIYAEALRDVAMWAMPVQSADIESKLAATALGRLLASPRWKGSGTAGVLVEALLGLQSFVLWAGERITAVDVNPLILGDGTATAVDGLVIPRSAAFAAGNLKSATGTSFEGTNNGAEQSRSDSAASSAAG